MKNKVKARLLQTPAILLLVAAFIASFYLAVTGQFSIGWATPITLLIILALYFWGRYLEIKTPY